MQNTRDTFFSRLAPHWAAAASAVSALLGIWPCIVLESSPHSPLHNSLVLLIFAPVIFFVVLLPMTFTLVRLLERLESNMTRSVICLIPVAAFLVMSGVPNTFSLVLIGFVSAWSYIYVRRTRTDAQDREEFFNE